jgi:MerR family transcriptional regulator, heat shock protein HspR
MPGPGPCEPCYVISVVARLVKMHPQTLRHYEKLGLIRPSRSDGRIRLFSQQDVQRLRKIQELQDVGVNPAGIKVILDLTERVADMQAELERLRARDRPIAL